MVDQPRASDQGTLTLLILTLPDSVRRRPTLFQLCFWLFSSSVFTDGKELTANSIPGWLVGTTAKMWCSVPTKTPSRTVRSETTPPVLKFLKPSKTR